MGGGVKVKKLTERQTEILDFIQHYTKEHNYPPTFREIGQALFADETGIYYHLERLRDWGIVDWQPNVSRTLRIVQASSDIDKLREENEYLRQALREALAANVIEGVTA